ncbi:MAG: ribokinase [Verrucomicrobiota bacterium]
MAGATVISVLGSLNVDYYSRVAAFPQPGETVAAEQLTMRFGGKGANQAVAAARMGGSVRMLGRVGEDGMGQSYVNHLATNGVDASGVMVAPGMVTGSAFITLDASAENTIVVGAGANGTWTAADVDGCEAAIAGSSVLLLQGEVPVEANLRAIEIANRSETLVVLNPSPWPSAFPWGQCRVDVMVVNEHEASTFFGMPIMSVDDLKSCAERAAARQVSAMMVTRGTRSTLALSGADVIEVPVRRLNPVDTVGAGDTFAGALAAGLGAAQSGELGAEEVVRRANVAAALSTQKTGAQEGMPGLEAVLEALAAGDVAGPVAPVEAG